MLPILAVVLGLAALALVLRGIFRSKRDGATLVPESDWRVAVDDVGLLCAAPDGSQRTLAWGDLTSIEIVTNDSGPFGCDVIWRFGGKAGDEPLLVPQGAEGDEALLAAAQKLPGFDNEEFIRAMGSTENAVFHCWRAPAGTRSGDGPRGSPI